MILFIRSSNYHIDGRLSRYLNIFKGKLDSGVLYWDRKNENAKNDNFRFYFPSSYGNGLRSIIGFVLWNFYILFFLIKNRKAITCVHAINLDTIIPVLIAKPIIKGTVVYDIYDCYADSHSIGGLMNYFVKRVERLCCSLSDTIILPDESRIKQSLLENSDFDIMIIENVPAIDCINLKEELHAEVRKIKFIYAGNLQKKIRGIESFIESIALIDQGELYICGDGELKDYCLEMDKKYNNINFLGRLSYVEMMSLAMSADVIIGMYYKSCPNHLYASPNKYYEHLALGKPLLTTIDTPPGVKVEINDTGWAIGEDAKDIRDFLSTINHLDIERKSKNARAVWERKYNNYYQSIVDNYIKNVIGGKK